MTRRYAIVARRVLNVANEQWKRSGVGEMASGWLVVVIEVKVVCVCVCVCVRERERERERERVRERESERASEVGASKCV